jgi:hypothetical protein
MVWIAAGSHKSGVMHGLARLGARYEHFQGPLPRGEETWLDEFTWCVPRPPSPLSGLQLLQRAEITVSDV